LKVDVARSLFAKSTAQQVGAAPAAAPGHSGITVSLERTFMNRKKIVRDAATLALAAFFSTALFAVTATNAKTSVAMPKPPTPVVAPKTPTPVVTTKPPVAVAAPTVISKTANTTAIKK
jgi:hypothetical protein